MGLHWHEEKMGANTKQMKRILTVRGKGFCSAVSAKLFNLSRKKPSKF